MAYTSAEARQELLESVAEAIDEIGFALASLGAAYEQLDEQTADTLEAQLFGPVQAAYGRLMRTHAESARRHQLTGVTFDPQAAGVASVGAKALIDQAIDAVARADGILAAVQDSPLLIEVGDVELRAGLTETRDLVGGLRGRAREIERTLGR